MRSKVKVTSREELLRNFTREFLIEEKKRCEIDRYVTDFRILIHNMPHENHNYLNRLLQDYTSMFLSHERISVNKSNEGEMKHRLTKQLASKMKVSPKKRYVKSFSNLSENSERQTYLVMKAKTAEFLQKLRDYEELEQIAYEIFIKHSDNEYENKIKYQSNQVYSSVPEEHILSLKTVEVPLEIPYKKTYKHVYIVNSPGTKHVIQDISDNNVTVNSSQSSASTTENLLQNYEYIKNTTAKFLENNRDYNDAEQKILSEQYQHNTYIKKYVDNLNSYNKDAKQSSSPKKGFFYKIKNIMGFSPENSVKSLKSKECEPVFKEETIAFLKNEKNFNNFEFESYKIFYTKNGKFQNPLLGSIENGQYKNAIGDKKNISSEEILEEKNVKIALQNKNAVKSSPPENEPTSLEVMKHIEFIFDPKIDQTKKDKVVERDYSLIKPEPNIRVTNENMLEQAPRKNGELLEQEINILKQQTMEFLLQQKKYGDEQNRFYMIFLNEHPTHTVKANYKRESLLHKIKQLFKFGRSDKSKEKLYYSRKLTDEFLRNEKYYCDQEHSALQSTIKRPSNLQIESLHKKDSFQAFQQKSERKTEEFSPKNTKRETKFVISPSVLHQRSRSEDLLTLKSKTKSLDYMNKTSPTGQKSFSDRLKRMVGIGNRRRTKSRENILHITDPVQYFLDHERIYYNGYPEDQNLYNRSVSLMSQPERKRTKSGNFLSPENMHHQDRKDDVSGKPPSGRRRQERRSDGEKNKRRSRTLSPAQKLVSKIKNIIHREGKKKENEENDEFLRNETEIFLKDQKNFVEIPRKESSNTYFNNSENVCRNTSENPMNIEVSVKEKHKVNENLTTKQTFAYPQTETIEKYSIKYSDPKLENQNDFVDEIEQRNGNKKIKASSAEEYKNEGSRKLEPSITASKQIVSEKFSPHSENNSSQITTNFHDKKESNFGNPVFSKYQTEIFLHDMKKHNDLNEAANAVNKTLIFVNNKTSTPASLSNIHESTGAVPKTAQNNKFMMINQTKNRQAKNIPDDLTQPTFTTPPKLRTSKNEQKNVEEVSEQKSYSNTVQHTTTKKETKVITRKVISEKIQKKSTTIFNVKNDESIMKKIEGHSQHQQVPISTEKISLYRFEDESKKIQDQENKEKIKNLTNQYTKNEKSFSEKVDSVDMPTQKQQKNLNATKGEINYSSPVTTLQSNEDDKYILQTAPILPAKQATSTQIGSTTHAPANNVANLLMRQTAEFLEHLKKYNTAQYEDYSKHEIIWLSDGKLLPQNHYECQVKNKIMETDIFKSSNEKRSIESNMLIKKQTDASLKDHQDFHNKQRKQDVYFLEEVCKAKEHSKNIHINENITDKINKLPSPTDSKKNFIIIDEKSRHFIAEEEVNPNSVLTDKKRVDLSNITTNQSALPMRKESPVKMEKVTQSSNLKIKSLKGDTASLSHTKENNKLISDQTAQFLKNLKKYNSNEYEASSKRKIVWLSEHSINPKKHSKKLQKKTPAKDIERSRSEESVHKSETTQLMKQQTADFLKDHKDYHNKQRNYEIKIFQKAIIPEKKMWLSSKSKGLTNKIRKLFSQTNSQESLIIYNDQDNQYLREQSAEFISKHQYFIYKEEVDFQKKVDPANSIINEVINIPKTNTDRSALPYDESIKGTQTKNEKVKKRTAPNLKSMIGGSAEQFQTKDDHKKITVQTAEFLDHLRKYNNTQYETSSKFKVMWLSGQKIVPKSQNKILQKKIECSSVSNDQEYKSYIFIKQQNDTFLKNHKDYHNKQRIEDNNFFQKANVAEDKLWLSSKISENKSISNKKKDLSSSTVSKKQLNTSDETAEFLTRNQYFINEEEIKHKLVLNPTNEGVRDATGELKVSTSQFSGPKDKSNKKSPTKIERAKKSTFSRIKSLIGGTPKEPSVKKEDNSISEQTAYFLDQLRRYNDNECEASSKLKVVWLSESKAISQKHDEELQKNEIIVGSMNKENYPEHKQYPHIKQQTDTFLKDHKNYHDTQRIEDNKFFQKAGKPEEKLWLSSNISEKKSISSKIKKLLSPTISKKTLNTSNDENYLLLRDQTAEFLSRNQYVLHEEEVNLKITQNPPDTFLEKVNSSQLSAPKDNFDQKSPRKTGKAKNSTYLKIKSLIGGTTKPSKIEKNYELMREQTAEFLKDLQTYNKKDYDTSSKNKIVWLSERKSISEKLDEISQKKVSTKVIEGSRDEEIDREYTSMFIKKQTDTFLKDHKDYHDKQRTDDNKFFQKVIIPEQTFCLSSNIPKNRGSKIKKLISPTDSQGSTLDNDDRINQLLRDQTAEFLSKHQYFIHEEEVKEISSDAIVKNVVSPIFNTNQSISPSDESEKQYPKKLKKETRSTLSKMKSLITGASEKHSIKEHNNFIRAQTADFLANLRKYNKSQYETSSKYKVTWLSERKIIPENQNEVAHEIKAREGIRRSISGKNDQEYKLYVFMKEQTDTFFKDHKNYHDKQRIEDNKFFQRAGIPEEQLWLSSYTSKKDSITSKIKKLLSPNSSKKPIKTNKDKEYIMLRDQTAEFLAKNQYFIHEEEVNPKITNDPSDIAPMEVTGLSKVTANQLSAPKDNIDQKSQSRIGKAKNSTVSKIKSLMGGTAKQSAIEKNHKLIRERTDEFLADLKRYNNKQYETSSNDKIVWLSEREIIPQKLDAVLLKEVPTVTKGKKDEEHDLEYKSYLFMKNQTDTFLKDHKDYHDKQRIEDNKFLQKAGIPEEKLWLSSYTSNKNNITSKIKKLLSPNSSKKTIKTIKDKEYIMLRDQTAEFLAKNQYFIHEEEVNPKITNDPSDIGLKEVSGLSKVSANQLSAPKDSIDQKSQSRIGKAKNSTVSKIKSWMGGTAKQSSMEKNHKLIREQTDEFLEDLKRYNSKQYETSSNDKIVWLSEREIIPQKLDAVLLKEIPTVTKGKKDEEHDLEYKSYLLMKNQTDEFLKDHKDYHNKQRIEDNKFFQNVGKPEEKIWLSSNNSKKRSITSKIKKLLSPSTSKKSLDASEDKKYLILRDQTAEFLSKNQYFIYKEELNPTYICNTANTNTKEVNSLLKDNISQSAPEKEYPITTKNVKKIKLSKAKPSTSGAAKQPPMENKDNLIIITDEFLEHLRKYNTSQYGTSSKFKIVWLSERDFIPQNQNEVLEEEVPRNFIKERSSEKNNDEVNLILREQKKEFLLKNLYSIHRDEMNFKTTSEPDNKIVVKKILTGPAKNKSNEESHLKSGTADKSKISKLKTDKVDTKIKIASEEDAIVENQTVESLKNKNKNSETNKSAVLLVSNEQKDPQIIKKKVTFFDNQLPSEDKDNFKTVIEQTKLFLKQNQDYHQKQWYDCKRFSQQNTKSARENTLSGTTESLPILSKADYMNSSHSPQKPILSHDRKVFKVMRDSSEKFLKKQQYLIHEEEINQNKIKPKPTPRKLKKITKTNQEKLVNLNNSSEEYQKMKKSVCFFLQDHQTYHNKERNEHIIFATAQKKNPGKLPKTSSAKEQKSKSKLISKLRSLVGGSTEIFSQEKKAKNDENELKKQTMEFLISQKCFWDLEGSAALKFVGKKQDSEIYNEGTMKKFEHAKKAVDKAVTPKIGKKEVVKLEKLPCDEMDNACDNPTVKPQREKQNKNYEFLKKQTELFLNNHQVYHDNQMKDFIAFSITRKQVHNESQNQYANNQNARTQNSSSNQKTLEMDSSTKNEIHSKTLFPTEKKENEAIVDPESTRNICEIFLDRQRYYTDSANEGWRRYVMYKPEVAIVKTSYPKSKSVNNKKQIHPQPKTTKIKAPDSEIESEKIEYEVTLHKTKLFLENHKNYHDKQQNEFARYAPKNIHRNNISEQLTHENKNSVLDRIKSMLPSSHSKSSYNVQKANLSSQNPENIAEAECLQVITKLVETPELKVNNNEKRIISKEQTDLFLKDHQEYHNRQKIEFDKYFENHKTGDQIVIPEEDHGKTTKPKKSVMSKIKSLFGTDTSKKAVNKLKGDDPFKTPTKIFLEDQKHFGHSEKTAEIIFNNSRAELEMKNSESSPSNQRGMNIKNYSVEMKNKDHEKMEKEEHILTNKSSVSPKEFYVTQEKEYDIPISRIGVNNLKETPLIYKEATTSPDSKIHKNKILAGNIMTLSSDEKLNISDDERIKYARDKLLTQELLLDQKKIANEEDLIVSHANVIQNLNNISKPPKSGNIKRKSAGNTNENITKIEDKSVIDIVSETPINISQNDSIIISTHNKSENEASVEKQVNTKVKGKLIPSAPSLDQCENLNEEEKKDIKSSLLQRVVSPMSPTKTIFKEIRSRDNSPDNRVYILSEGYTITREGNEIDKTKNTCITTNETQVKQSEPKRDTIKISGDNRHSPDIPETVDGSINNEHKTQKLIRTSVLSLKNSETPEVKKPHEDKRSFQDAEIFESSCTIGQDSSTDSNEYLPSQRITQSDLEVRRQYTKRRTYREMEEEPRSFITETRIENNGTVTQRYTTSCYFHQVPTPVWYSQSLIVDLEEKSQKIDEKVYYDNQLRPESWSETFETEIPLKRNMFVSEAVIPVTQEFEDIHYISLEHQQMNPPSEMI